MAEFVGIFRHAQNGYFWQKTGMKSSEEIKAALHQLIDVIDDEDLLNQMIGDIVPYVIEFRRRHPARSREVDLGNIDWDAYRIDPDDPGARN